MADPTPSEGRPRGPGGPSRKPPRDPNGSDAEGPADRKARMVMSITLALVVGLFLVSYLAPRASTLIPYYDFKERVRADRVADVSIAEETITGHLRPAAPTTPGTPGTPPAGVASPHATPMGISLRPGRTPDFETVRVADPGLVPLLEEHHVRYAGAPESHGAMQLVVYAALALGAVLAWRSIARRLQGPGGGVLAFGKSKSKVFEESEVNVRFSDVAGVDEAKEELQEVVQFLRNPEKFIQIGARIPKGVLLVGPPGTGKTLLARAVAGEAGVTFYSISGSEFVEMFVGVGAARVRDLFENAQQHAPCIVFIDELDALGRSRGSNVMGTNEEREQTLNQLLVEMDGFQVNTGVIILGATNRPEILDPALLRPGRFDRQVLVDRPDRAGREAILRVHARGVKLAVDVDMADLAARTPGFAGADLANIMNEAALLAARRDRTQVSRKDIEEAIERVAAGLERRSRIISPEERRRVAYHEVGHAIVGEVLPGGSHVAKISIVPRGVAALGYTMKLPTEERFLMTQSELTSLLAGLLGGRVAEAITFGEVSTGAGDDLARATDLARAMVVDYGMSARIGPVTLGAGRTAAFLPDREGTQRGMREHGEHLADLVDDEVKRLVESAETQARTVLQGHRDALDRIATALIEREYLDGDELRRMLAELHTATATQTDDSVTAPAA